MEDNDDDEFDSGPGLIVPSVSPKRRPVPPSLFTQDSKGRFSTMIEEEANTEDEKTPTVVMMVSPRKSPLSPRKSPTAGARGAKFKRQNSVASTMGENSNSENRNSNMMMMKRKSSVLWGKVSTFAKSLSAASFLQSHNKPTTTSEKFRYPLFISEKLSVCRDYKDAKNCVEKHITASDWKTFEKLFYDHMGHPLLFSLMRLISVATLVPSTHLAMTKTRIIEIFTEYIVRNAGKHDASVLHCLQSLENVAIEQHSLLTRMCTSGLVSAAIFIIRFRMFDAAWSLHRKCAMSLLSIGLKNKASRSLILQSDASFAFHEYICAYQGYSKSKLAYMYEEYRLACTVSKDCYHWEKSTSQPFGI